MMQRCEPLAQRLHEAMLASDHAVGCRQQELLGELGEARVQSTAMAVTLHEATARWRVGSPAAVDVEVSREADEVHLLVWISV